MKNNNLYKLIVAFVMLMGIVSCEDRENLVIEPTGSAIIMDLSTSNLVLDENFPANPALTVTWEPSTYSVPMEVKYSLDISSSATFENSYTLTSTQGSLTHAAFNNKELNEAAKKIGLLPYVAQKMYFRVSSYIGSTSSMLQTSAITNLTITPYAASPTYEYADLYLIGDATAGGWGNDATNGNLLPLLKSATSTKYTFTGLFKVGGFKMVRNKGSWDAQFGLGSPGQLSTDGGSGNIPVATEGYYKLTVDTAALTYTFEPATAPTATYGTVSIIGNNNDWNNDIQLTQSSFDPHLWMAKELTLNAGEFKFRADNNWTVSWGKNSEYFGTATMGGDNIPMASEWDYDVYFNDATGDYTIIPVQ